MMPGTVSFVATFVVSASNMLSPSNADEPVEAERPIVFTEAQLDSVITRLANKETRLSAIERLYRSSGGRIFRGNGTIVLTEKVRKGITDALDRHGDVHTAEQAMRSDSEPLRAWGLDQLSNRNEGGLESWRYLVPLVRELAKDPSANVRSRAQSRLRGQPEQNEFLASLIDTETSADNVIYLIGDGPKLSSQLNPQLMRLLNHPEAEARQSALRTIERNLEHPEFRKIQFADDVVERVFELALSPIESDRIEATYAILKLHNRFPDRVRKCMLKCAHDSSVEVRRRVARSLTADRDLPEVRENLERLLRDESASVQFNAIFALGVEDHLDELRRLAVGPDKRVARMAQERLDRMQRGP